eukprot:Clim_evm6s207 gene=Clim_evmTU6s207
MDSSEDRPMIRRATRLYSHIATGTVGMDKAPRSLELRTHRGKIAVKEWGKKHTDPRLDVHVLFVHGWLDNSGSWDRLIPRVIEGLGKDVSASFVAIDLPGHGLSDHRPDGYGYHFTDWVGDVYYTLETLGWIQRDQDESEPSRNIVLCGHSMGAAISTLVAGTFPELVSRLILVDGLVPWPGRKVEDTARHLRDVISSDGPLCRTKPRGYETVQEAMDRLREVNPYLETESVRCIVERGVVKQDDNTYIFSHDRRLRNFTGMPFTVPHVRSFLHSVRCPIALIAGSEGMKYPEDYFQEVCRILYNREAKFEVRNMAGTHHLHLDTPEVVAPHFTELLIDSLPKYSAI